MNYELIKERLKDISFEFKGRGFQEECDFVLKELVSVVNMKIYQQQIMNDESDDMLDAVLNGLIHLDNLVNQDNTHDGDSTKYKIPKKWCMNNQCYCTGDCQRMIKTPVELDNFHPFMNITERSKKF